MKKIFFMALAAIALGACNSEPKFKVEGEVSGADGKMLYLEASALEGIVPLDSVKLEGDGSFHFKQVRPVFPPVPPELPLSLPVLFPVCCLLLVIRTLHCS